MFAMLFVSLFLFYFLFSPKKTHLRVHTSTVIIKLNLNQFFFLLNYFCELHYLRSGEMLVEKEKRRKYTKRRGKTAGISCSVNDHTN